MSLYHYSRTNGQYSGLGHYYGLGGKGGKGGKGHGKGHGKGPGQPFAKEGHRESMWTAAYRPAAPKPTPESLTQRSIQAGKKAEFFEQRAGAALEAGKDKKAAAMMAQANFFQAKSDKLENRAESLQLPYTDVPMLPKGIAKKADEAAVDTPMAIADQTAPLPDSTPVPATASLTARAVVPTTLPMTPPPLLLPPAPMPGRPIMMGPPPAASMMLPAAPMQLPGGISPKTAATAAAALAASYFLFF